MNEWNTEQGISVAKRFAWHPFTDMCECRAPEYEPVVLIEKHGAVPRDRSGRAYMDGNSSIWRNIHGHNHPPINVTVRAQLDRAAHASFLDFRNCFVIAAEKDAEEITA